MSSAAAIANARGASVGAGETPAHVPRCPGRSHRPKDGLQAVLQQTPSTQKPVAHSAGVAHAPPCGMPVLVGVAVGVLVGVCVTVPVLVTVAVVVTVPVVVAVAVLVGVFVGVFVGVLVGVLVGVEVGVNVAQTTAQVKGAVLEQLTAVAPGPHRASLKSPHPLGEQRAVHWSWQVPAALNAQRKEPPAQLIPQHTISARAASTAP